MDQPGIRNPQVCIFQQVVHRPLRLPWLLIFTYALIPVFSRCHSNLYKISYLQWTLILLIILDSLGIWLHNDGAAKICMALGSPTALSKQCSKPDVPNKRLPHSRRCACLLLRAECRPCVSSISVFMWLKMICICFFKLNYSTHFPEKSYCVFKSVVY